MKKPYRQADGFYHVDGNKYKTLFGSREQVMNGTVHKTTGGLTKADLVMNKWGRIVSAKKFKTAKKEMRLQKHGFFAKKGKFGAITRKFRGGKVDDESTVYEKKQDEAANKITNIIPAASPAASTTTQVTPAPTATDPAPTAPAPTDPAPTAPAPAPTDPAPTAPAPTAPAPTAPAPAPDSASKTGGAKKKSKGPQKI